MQGSPADSEPWWAPAMRSWAECRCSRAAACLPHCGIPLLMPARAVWPCARLHCMQRAPPSKAAATVCALQVSAKQAEGFAVVDFKCGTEREGATRNLYYHVLLRKPGTV